MSNLSTSQKRKLRESRDPAVVVIYCRVSSRKQAETGFGLDAQERACVEYCFKNAMEVIEVFKEPGISAMETEKRTEYIRMLMFCYENERVSKIVVRSMDRYSADLFRAFRTLYDLRTVGVEVVDIRFPIDTNTAEGRRLQNRLIVDAAYERELGSERTIGAMTEARLKGYFVGYAPMGYINAKTDNNHGTLTIDPIKGPLVQTAFEMVSEGGHTLASVLWHLNHLGLTTRFGSPLSMKSLREMLKNPVYIGKQYVQGYDQPVLGRWDPLVTELVFDSVQVVVGGARSTKLLRRDDSWRYPLRRFLKCSFCGSLTGSPSKGCYPYYHCTPKRNCGKVRISPSSLHMLFAFFLNGLALRLGRYTLILLAVSDLQKEHRSIYVEQIKKIKRTIAQLDKQRDTTEKELIHNPRIPDEICLRDLERIACEKTEAELKLVRLHVKVEHSECIIAAARRFLRNLSAIWVLSDLEQRQKMQLALFPEPHRLSLDIKQGFTVPEENLIVDGAHSHTFECFEPTMDLKAFGEFLCRYNQPTESWESVNEVEQ